MRWDDGTHTGTPPFPHVEAAIERESGRRLQLRRIVDELRRTLAGPGAGLELLASARTRIDALADAEPSAGAALARRDREHHCAGEPGVRGHLHLATFCDS